VAGADGGKFCRAMRRALEGVTAAEDYMEAKRPAPTSGSSAAAIAMSTCVCRNGAMNTFRSIFVGAALLALPAEAQEHRFEDDPVATVRETFVACDVLSQLQRVMDDPRSLLAGECVPLRAGDRVRVYARRRSYFCIYPHDRISPCKWTHEKALSK
jgi:hypothetical protein